MCILRSSWAYFDLHVYTTIFMCILQSVYYNLYTTTCIQGSLWITRSSIESRCYGCCRVRRMARRRRRQTFETWRRRRVRLMPVRRFRFGVAAVALAVDIVVAVAVVVVVNVNVVVVLGFGVVLVTWSARFEGILSLAVDAVEQELWNGFPWYERIVVGNLR